MGTIDRAVEAVPLIVAIRLERLEQPQPLPPLRPPVKPVEHRFPRTELTRQIAPRYARTAPPQDRLDEVAIVASPAPGSSLGLQHRFDLLPLLISQLCTSHRIQMEHTLAAMEIACGMHSKFRPPQQHPPRSPGTGTGTGTFTGERARSIQGRALVLRDRRPLWATEQAECFADLG